MLELLKDIVQCFALLISIFLNTILTYLILTKSNSKMGSYKYIMMYLSLSALCYSVLGMIVRPVSLKLKSRKKTTSSSVSLFFWMSFMISKNKTSFSKSVQPYDIII